MNGNESLGEMSPPAEIVHDDTLVEEQNGKELQQDGFENSRDASVCETETETEVAPKQGHQVLPEPSPEQREIIRAVGEGKCVTIRACAGSGKTTCMLQVAASLPVWRKALIITYNRSLADECKERIQRLSMGHRIKCYTIHGLASRFAGRVCNDDHKLVRQADRWDKGLDKTPTYPMPLDLVMIDEAQDLRPLFHRILSHIFSISGGSGIQLCLVGDPKQMLYDFPTFGDDKASTSFFLQPEKHWGEFTKQRSWAHLPLSVSYRLTPNMASFCNLFWGTTMVGGNVKSPNIPVEYLIKYPYPGNRDDDDDKLKTSALEKLIDDYGPENVMFLAQSVKRADLPIRVHVNQLMKKKEKITGLQKYNFHIKENVRGFEGSPDTKNKVRVWTFCGSKGCEADVVVVFGLDVYGRPHALNQVGVALSRARKRLLVIHSKKYQAKKLQTLPFYPVLGDSPDGMDRHTIRFGKDNSEEVSFQVPPIDPTTASVQNGGEGYATRCQLTRKTLETFATNGVIKIDNVSNLSKPMSMTLGLAQKETKQVYVATEFNYFSASAESRFLEHGTWTKCGLREEAHNNPIGEEDVIQGDRIDYETNVQFSTTIEDVSALYGEAVVYMLQWELCKFVPNIETIVSDGMLRLHLQVEYSETNIRSSLRNMCCEALTLNDDETLTKEFVEKNGRIKGKDLIPFLNNRLNIKKSKKRDSGADGKVVDEVLFPVKAIERTNVDDDNHLTEFLPQIKSLYESEACAKKPFHWVYLANAVMAYSNYHEKFRQIGTDPSSYESWVDSKALTSGLERLRNLMDSASPSSIGTSSFEQELSSDFATDDRIKEESNGRTIVGVGGVCDWINRNRGASVTKGHQEYLRGVDLLEIKFVHHLSNIHRLQVLVYSALCALEVNNVEANKCTADDGQLCTFDADDYEWKIECCRGMLYNARTGEKEICTINARDAMDFLLDISQFKYNGKDRKTIKKEQKSSVSKSQVKSENSFSAPNDSVPSAHQPLKRKKRLIKNTGKSYYMPLCVDDDDNESQSTKRLKESLQGAKGDGTGDDPIILD